LSAAVAAGHILKSPRCYRCGAVGPVEAHHPDYSKPLAVE
jgi:hypothetical protein